MPNRQIDCPFKEPNPLHQISNPKASHTTLQVTPPGLVIFFAQRPTLNIQIQPVNYRTLKSIEGKSCKLALLSCNITLPLNVRLDFCPEKKKCSDSRKIFGLT